MEIFNAELVEKLQDRIVAIEFTMEHSDIERLRSLLKYAFPDYNGRGIDHTKRYFYGYKSYDKMIWTCGYSLPDPKIRAIPFDEFFTESPVDVLFGRSMGKPTRAEGLESQAYLEYVLNPKNRKRIRLMRDIQLFAKQRNTNYILLLDHLTKTPGRSLSLSVLESAQNLFGSRLNDLFDE